MTGSQALSFAAAALVLTLLPGPDTLLVLRQSLRGGRRAGLWTSLGICSGLYVHALVSALGMAALLTHSRTAFRLMQGGGALYLGVLGLSSLRTALRPGTVPSLDLEGPAGGSVPHLLLGGFLCNVLNPKAMLFYAALLPQFLLPTDPVLRTSLLLTSLHGLEGMAWLSVLSLGVERIRPRLLHPVTLRLLEGLTGVLLTGLSLRMALTL